MSKIIEQAEAALAAAEAAYQSELQRDAERHEGSGAQERRREAHQQALRADIDQCKRELAEARQEATEADLGVKPGLNSKPGGGKTSQAYSPRN
ncbi:hypothetical protein NPJ88_000130 [Halomonas elongata]|uniref:hypothetical protein n=1 Tax=Halomonas elongata TaxID=2746 RepID=UPI00255AB80E|nr:hypothetical protein [Halomonas elongata]MDL4860729.1 hypothetical protein [Halomonas elongata]